MSAPDVFISYARNDAGTARQFAEAFAAEGLDVWWDNSLQAGEVFDEVIEEALGAARSVVVLWSPDAVASRWVRAEATLADQNRTLVPAIISSCRLPIVFAMTQAAELSDWNGDRGDENWLQFLGPVKQMISARPRKSVAPVPNVPAEARPEAKPPGISIVVLPFANMSGDAEQEYFSDGITEDIITDLSKVSALAVVSRNSAFIFKGKNVEIPEVGRLLNVSHVLEGSVRKAGNRIRVTAQLIDAAANNHVWAERYDRELDDIFELQDELSQAIVKALRVKLLPSEKKAIAQRGTDSVEAYNLFLMARQENLNSFGGSRQHYETIRRICLRAVEIDPKYADAWAMLAMAQSRLSFVFAGSPDSGLEAAERALSIDPHHANALAVKAFIVHEGNDVAQANAAIETALRLDPESWEVNYHAATIAFRQEKFEVATRHFEKCAKLEDTSYRAPGMLITCYRAIGQLDRIREAAEMTLRRCEVALAEDRNNAGAMAMGSDALAVLGERERAKEWMSRAILVDPENLNARYNFACGLAANLDDLEGALELLEPCMKTMSEGFIQHAKIDPDLDPLRGDPRFIKMLEDAELRIASRN